MNGNRNRNNHEMGIVPETSTRSKGDVMKRLIMAVLMTALTLTIGTNANAQGNAAKYLKAQDAAKYFKIEDQCPGGKCKTAALANTGNGLRRIAFADCQAEYGLDNKAKAVACQKAVMALTFTCEGPGCGGGGGGGGGGGARKACPLQQKMVPEKSWELVKKDCECPPGTKETLVTEGRKKTLKCECQGVKDHFVLLGERSEDMCKCGCETPVLNNKDPKNWKCDACFEGSNWSLTEKKCVCTPMAPVLKDGKCAPCDPATPNLFDGVCVKKVAPSTPTPYVCMGKDGLLCSATTCSPTGDEVCGACQDLWKSFKCHWLAFILILLGLSSLISGVFYLLTKGGFERGIAKLKEDIAKLNNDNCRKQAQVVELTKECQDKALDLVECEQAAHEALDEGSVAEGKKILEEKRKKRLLNRPSPSKSTGSGGTKPPASK